MRYFWIFLFCGVAQAMTPIANDYSDPQGIFYEMRNIFDNAQDQSFTTVSSTPNYQDLKDGSMVVYLSTWNAPNIKLMLRIGTTVYFSPDFPIIKGR